MVNAAVKENNDTDQMEVESFYSKDLEILCCLFWVAEEMMNVVYLFLLMKLILNVRVLEI